MLSPYRFAGIITVTFAACGPARAQELAPPGSGVSVHKLSMLNGLSRTVKYYVQGGSPRLQAMVRRVEWAENELSVIEQLQQLKLETVVNERHVLAFRAAQLTDPYFPGGFIPYSIATGTGGWGEGTLQSALGEQLAAAATPGAALRLIGFLEQLQTDLDKELKALPPQEREAAQGPIDALRPRVAALPRHDVPPVRSQPLVPGRASVSSPVSQVQVGTTRPMAAPQVRFPAQTVPQEHPTAPNLVAFQPTVPQDQERLSQQIMQMQQQLMQRLQETFPQHPLKLMALRR